MDDTWKKLEAEATAGPWQHDHDDSDHVCVKTTPGGVPCGWFIAYTGQDAALIVFLRNRSPQLRAVVEAARGCSNSPCAMTGPKTGMHTNGGCHCRQRLRDALRALDEVGHE